MFSEIIGRISAPGTTFHQVAGAAEFPADEADVRQLDACFVIPLAERAGPNGVASGGVEQQVKMGIGVVIVASRSGQTSGQAVDVLTPHKRWIKDQLMGWAPTGCEPIELAPGHGRLMKLGGRMIFWQMEFITAYYERKV